nr:protein phosphatase 1 regulatory subunit 37-like [Lytechinus pictus]
MKVKPSQSIIRQLQMVKDFTVRAESLNLQGEKLDLKAVETLEEVFKRVQFNTIDVEGTSMDDEATMAMCDMIEFYQSTCKLIYASNRSIGFRGWQAASRLLRRTPCLHTFDARNTCWTEHSMPAMSRAMRVDSSITALHLEACNLSGRPHFLLMSALRTNSTLREIFLADNRLMPSDAIHIGGMLRHNSGLKLLDLRNNNIQDTGLSHISNGLSAQSKGGLSTLVLWNNHITHNGVAHLGKALIKSTNLETLNLGQNNLGTDGIHFLKDGLMKNKALMRLGLYACKISDEGAVALAEYLADNCYLMRLDLRENDIRTGGMMALSLSLNVNTILLRLDLDKDVKKESLKGYEELQQALLSEICSHLSRNRTILEQRQKEEEERAKNAYANQKAQSEKTDNEIVNATLDPKVNEMSRQEVVRDTRDPLMGIESAQEALVVLGSRPKSGQKTQKPSKDVKPQEVGGSSIVSGLEQNGEVKEILPSSMLLVNSAIPLQSHSEGGSISTQELSSEVSSSSLSTVSASSLPSSQPQTAPEGENLFNSDHSPSVIPLLAHSSRSGSITKIEIPKDESKLLHSDSIDVESPTSPTNLKPLDIPSAIPDVNEEQVGQSVGVKTVVGRAIGEAGEVPSPDTEPFGRGVPLNIDGKIGNRLMAGITENPFVPVKSGKINVDPEPSPDLERDIDHMLAAAHGL